MTCCRYLSDPGECKEIGMILIRLDCQYDKSKSRKSKLNDDVLSNLRVCNTKRCLAGGTTLRIMFGHASTNLSEILTSK